MTTTHPLTLAEAMDAVAAIAVRAARDPDAIPHTLHLFADDGALTLCTLSVGGGREIATAALLLIAQADAAIAVLATETWMFSGKRDSPTPRRILQGEMQVKDVPADDRGEALVLIGEDRHGATAERCYLITPGRRPTDKRTVAPHPAWADGSATALATHFHPLFSIPALMRSGATEAEARAAAKEGATQIAARLFGPPDPPGARA